MIRYNNEPWGGYAQYFHTFGSAIFTSRCVLRFSSTESGFRMSPVFVHDAGQDHAADSLRDLPGIGGTSQLSC
jgi:hypothetical protein